MEETIFLNQWFKQLIAKVGTSIIDDRPWGAKSGEDILLKEYGNILAFIVGERDLLYLF